jgi:hypothetical protein
MPHFAGGCGRRALRGRTFSWDAVAARTIDALETCYPHPRPRPQVDKPSLVCVVSAVNQNCIALMCELDYRFAVTLVSDGHDPRIDLVDTAVACASYAWFRNHLDAHDHVLHVMDVRPNDQAKALFLASPGVVLLSSNWFQKDDEAISVTSLYREHGLSAAATAARDGVAVAAGSYPMIGEWLSPGQGVIVPTREIAETVVRCYGPRASTVVEIAAMADPVLVLGQSNALPLSRVVATTAVQRWR